MWINEFHYDDDSSDENESVEIVVENGADLTGIKLKFYNGVNGQPYGDLPKRYPDWLDPILLDLDETFGLFPRAKKLTEAGDIILLEAPGYTYGHCSLLLETEEANLFFDGDVIYTEDQLTRDRYAVANVSPNATKVTYRQVKELANMKDLLILPSHEEAVLDRLSQSQYFQ